MIEMTLGEGGALLDAAIESSHPGASGLRFRGVATDSRRDCAGMLFFALRGPKFDAHDHVDDAVRAGAAAVVTDRRVRTGAPQLVVGDTRGALVRLAAAWRRRFDVPFAAVTGSNGKTTVKEMTAAIFRQRHRTLATAGNLNTDVGLAATLFGLDCGHRRGVAEMGANHAGEIAGLAAMCAPRAGVVTQCAPAHLEGFGDVAGVARAKGELFESLPPDGIGVVNADDPFAEFWTGQLGKRRVLRFGLERPADVRAAFAPAEGGGSRLALATPCGGAEVRLALPGRHNVMNALAACAAGIALGEPLDAIRDGLEAMKPVPGRLCERPLANGSVLIDDTYNANPGSLRAALDVLAGRRGERWLVLGDMAELGEDGPALHREAGCLARGRGVARLYGVGALAAEAAAGFGPEGRHHPSHDALIAELRTDLRGRSPVTALVKGSRSMGMERVVQALADRC